MSKILSGQEVNWQPYTRKFSSYLLQPVAADEYACMVNDHVVKRRLCTYVKKKSKYLQKYLQILDAKSSPDSDEPSCGNNRCVGQCVSGAWSRVLLGAHAAHAKSNSHECGRNQYMSISALKSQSSTVCNRRAAFLDPSSLLAALEWANKQEVLWVRDARCFRDQLQ